FPTRRSSEVADVVVVQVHVHELVERPVLRDDLAARGRELADQVLQHLAHRPPVGLHRGLASRVLAKDGGQADFYGHGPSRTWRRLSPAMLPILYNHRLLAHLPVGDEE